jgi:hypothetical protein
LVSRGLPAAALACLALALSALPADGAAAHQRAAEIFPGSPLTVEFRLKASNGYAVSVYGVRNRVILAATRGRASAQYSVRGVVSKDGVEARFGKLGRVSVAFTEKRMKRVPSSILGCRGGPEVQRLGTFAGTIGFRGERGYTEVRAHTARGKTAVSPRWTCPPGSNSTSGLEIPDQVDLGASCGTTGFAAIGHRSVEDGPPVFPDDPAGTSFLAFSRTARGRMTVTRLALAFGKQTDFLFDNAFSFATVTPPPPFHGSATLSRDPSGGASWEGSLSVSLPGEELALVDPRFKVALKRYRRERVESSFVLASRMPCRPSG